MSAPKCVILLAALSSAACGSGAEDRVAASGSEPNGSTVGAPSDMGRGGDDGLGGAQSAGGGANLPTSIPSPDTSEGPSDAIPGGQDATEPPQLIQIGAGNTHTCVLRSDRTLACWGATTGFAFDNSVLAWSPVTALAAPSDVEMFAAGGTFSCAVVTDSDLVCWGGRSNGGQLGRGEESTVPSSEPASVGISDATTVGATLSRACAVHARGRVSCWGYAATSSDGQAIDSSSPVQIGVESAIAVSVGEGHACAALTDGRISCWGSFHSGQLGASEIVGADGLTAAPVFVEGVQDATVVSAGQVHTCSLRQGGRVSCWGDNTSGQVGTGTMSDEPSVVPVDVVDLANATQLSCGWRHCCVVTSDGSVSCWGRNDYGQLGDGTLFDSATPLRVPNLARVLRVTSGRAHTCVLLLDGGVQCWGANTHGQLGNGTTTDSPVPVFVEGL